MKKSKRDKQLENKVAKDFLIDAILRILKKEYPQIIQTIQQKNEAIIEEQNRMIQELQKENEDLLNKYE